MLSDFHPESGAIFSKTVNKILAYGLDQGWPDIQLEITADGTLEVRYMLDGQTIETLLFDPLWAENIFTYVKDLAGLSQKNYTGRFAWPTAPGKITVLLVNTAGGELLDLKITAPESAPLFLDELSLPPEQLALFRDNILNQGLTVISGPGDAGKTISGLACLLAADPDFFNLYAVSNKKLPDLPGVNQITIKDTPQDWNKTLVAISRQDADILFLDEPNLNFEAALLARLSSSRGLIISVQADDNWSALKKLSEAGLYGGVATPTLNLLANQRLIRRLCPDCSKAYEIDELVFQALANDFDLLGQDLLGLQLFKAGGCANCQHSGYAGSLGLFEVVKANSELSNLLAKNKTAARAWLKNAPALSLLEDGFIKALKGLTTIEEIKKIN